MNTTLIPELPDAYSDAVNRQAFFSTEEDKKANGAHEARERPPIGKPGLSCHTNLFFGFFFDGTKNNYLQAEKGKNHSNVARLYDCYPGLSVKGVLDAKFDWKYNLDHYTHFFKTYVPGVASPFKQVGDTGEGIDATLGGGVGAKGGHRIAWALIQALNNIHRYFYKQPLVPPEEEFSLVLTIEARLTKENRALLRTREPYGSEFNQSEQRATIDIFESLLKRLHAKVEDRWPEKTAWEKVRDFAGYPKPRTIDPAIVQTIYVSIFGFSRGATQARAFVNWFQTLCELDSAMTGRGQGSTLGGFDVKIDFLGIFDTVASVGAGNSFGNSYSPAKLCDGHSFWADAEDSLRIPEGVRCVHLVAAHELRRSFPLDSIAVKQQQLPPNCKEIVVPGVHSDLGCGYAPLEQGRGTEPTGADMIARIALIYMYREARLAGVPLKLEFASDVAKKRFQVNLETIKALNGYLATCKVKSGSLTGIMREQANKQMQWRLARRVISPLPIQKSSSYLRASTFDKNDLLSAAHEFEEEIAAFQKWLAEKKKGTFFRRKFVPEEQGPGFGNVIEDEWEEIATWWDQYQPPCAAVMTLFDDYVHDSRAWFKIIPMSMRGDANPDNEADLRVQLAKWGKDVKLTSHDWRTPEQIRLGKEYARNNAIPAMTTVGREPWSVAGYLRYRKIYAGFDGVLLSDASDVDDLNRAPDEAGTAARA